MPPTTVRAKFTVLSKEPLGTGLDSQKITLAPLYDTSIPEDQRFSKATPCGSFWMQVDNPSASEALQIGKAYYIDITPAEA